jgi:hypothetical protein
VELAKPDYQALRQQEWAAEAAAQEEDAAAEEMAAVADAASAAAEGEAAPPPVLHLPIPGKRRKVCKTGDGIGLAAGRAELSHVSAGMSSTGWIARGCGK